MRKRARRIEIKEDSISQEWINQLPDDVLVTILSELSLKDAVVTSLLSRRWRYLWTYIPGLNFDANAALDKIAAEPKLLRVERPKYINWVNRVVGKHKAVTIDEFRIGFDLDKSSKNAIDWWVKFAIGKRVQRLELDLLEKGETLRQPSRNYVFPHKILTQSKGCSLRRSTLNVPTMEPCTSIGLKFLKELSLKCVNVGEEALENILASCPALEYLSMHGSGDLVNITINDPSLMLKTFEIVFCLGIETIQIYDTNLVSFSYLGPGIDLILQNVPKLKEISIGQGYSGLENNVFDQISRCLGQIEVLTLDIYRPEDNIKHLELPELPNLKQLMLKLGAWDDDSLLDFTSLVEACPYLEKFVVQLIWMSPTKKRRKIRRAPKFLLKHLKLVEICGYYGRTSDVELAVYFMQNAVGLQKLVIDPRNQILERTPGEYNKLKREEAARTRAKQQLETKKPPGVQLVIL